MADNPTFAYAAPYDRANDANVDYKPTRHGAWTGIGVGACRPIGPTPSTRPGRTPRPEGTRS